MVAAVRLHELEEMFDGVVRLQWKSFLLRPEPPTAPRSLEEFKRYTESWRRPAAEEPRAGFRIWEGDESPPSYSVPPHVVAKAAEAHGSKAFEAVHRALLEAYFQENRNITDAEVLEDLWTREGLDAEAFPALDDQGLHQRVYADHLEAMENGASGAPAVRLDGFFGVLMGAQPTEVYARWMHRVIEREITAP
ncbi:MAG: DsbA family protein [Acidobacteriota bacterium]